MKNKILFLISILFIFFVCTSLISDTKRKGLLINVNDEYVTVNTNPQQPIDLGIYHQPRLLLEVKWSVENKNNVKIILLFISMGKKIDDQNFILVKRKNEDINLAAQFKERQTKSGTFETVEISINIEQLKEFTESIVLPEFIIGKLKFIIHPYEFKDLKEAYRIWESL